MTLDVLDELTLARLGRVEVGVSLYWDEPYNTEGAFTLEVRPTEENLSLLREGRWLRRSDSDVPMRICHRTNANEDKNLVCTGSPATWILTKRVSTAIVKAGKDGCYACSDTERFYMPALPVKAIDSTGAGDSFVAGFIAGLLEQKSLWECCEKGTKCAAECVGHAGAV